MSAPASLNHARSTDRPRRAAVLLLVIAGHLLLLLWFITRPAVLQPAPVRSSAMILVELPDGGQPAPPAPRPIATARVVEPLPMPAVPIVLPSPLPAASAAGETEPSGDAGSSGCHLSDDTATAIRQDPAAMAELAALPPGLRTQADAVMIWNGRWLGDNGSPSLMPYVPPFVPGLQRVVSALIAGAPAECRDAVETGPVFLAIPETGRTTMLVIGSGSWRWADLLSPADEPLPTQKLGPLR